MIKHERLWRDAGGLFRGSTVGQNMREAPQSSPDFRRKWNRTAKSEAPRLPAPRGARRLSCRIHGANHVAVTKTLIVSDVRLPTLAIVCEACGRRGRYSVERLVAQHGDAKSTDLLQTVVDCPKARCAAIHGRSKEGLHCGKDQTCNC
jgi:hypothetical protein